MTSVSMKLVFSLRKQSQDKVNTPQNLPKTTRNKGAHLFYSTGTFIKAVYSISIMACTVSIVRNKHAP